jgi:hypothetical protein
MISNQNKPKTMLISTRILAVAALTLCAVNAQGAPTNLTPDSAPASASLRTNLEKPAKKTTGVIEAGWNMSLSGETFANEKEQAQTAGLELGGKIRYGLLPSLEMKADAGIALQSGYAQSRFGDNTPKSGLDLHEALIQYKPLSRVTLQAGAINQAQLNSPLLVSAQAFPAALERILLGSKEFNVEVKAEQAVPTSTTMSTQSVEAEQTPTFMTEGLTGHAKFADRVSLSIFGLHYAFHNLPSTVANESELFGNTVTQVTAKQDKFAYAFDGFEYGSGLKVLLTRELIWTLDGQVIQNSKAPDSFNQGQIASSGFEIGLPGDIDLKPKAEIFFAESDIAPGFYNGSDRGHNNRTGWAADLSATFKKAGFLVGGRFVQSDLINESVIQTSQSFIMLRFETLYALF